MSLSIAGSGPIEDFTADINLSTDGQSRLSGGQVSLSADAPPSSDAALGGFRASLAGDPSPLLSGGDMVRFFGSDVLLGVQGERHPDGGDLDLTSVRIRTRVMEFSGTARINALGWAERAQIIGTIADPPDGAPVPLPGSEKETWLDQAQVSFDFDSAVGGPEWTGSVTVTGLRREDIALEALRLTGNGTLSPPQPRGLAAQITGTLDVQATGIAPPSDPPALAQAVGPFLTGQLSFAKRDQARIRVKNVNLRGADYALSGQASFGGVDWQRLDLLTTGDMLLQAQDLSRFATLSGQALSGAADLRITGTASLVRGGAFDVIVDGTGQDLAIGIDAFDQPFAGGASHLSFMAWRDLDGTRVEDFEILSTGGANATGSATLAPPNTSHVAARINVAEAGLLVDGLSGALSLDGTAARYGGDIWQVDLDTTAPGETTATLSGEVTMGRDGPTHVNGRLQAEVGTLTAYSRLAGRNLSGGAATLTTEGQFDPPITQAITLSGNLTGSELRLGLGSYDRLTAGQSTADFTLHREGNGVVMIDKLDLTTRELDIQIAAGADGTMDLDARLRDLGLVVPGLFGPFTADGTARQTGTGWQVALNGAGPGGDGCERVRLGRR